MATNSISKYIKDNFSDEILPDEVWAMLKLIGDTPTIEEIWALMDLAWLKHKVNPAIEKTMATFYADPVWLLNGFFTEIHKESIENRETFARFITSYKPTRIADYGGGYGAFGRTVARMCPNTQVEIIEPYPSHFAQKLCQDIPNIKYAPRLTDQYDFIVAMDVLEHVMQPLNLVYEMSQYCNFKNGGLLLCNCFYPVIKCHLPQTMYLRHIFSFLLSRMGLKEVDNILYGSLYVAQGIVLYPDEIRTWHACAKKYALVREMIERGYHALKSLIRL